jgi:hypothetical protein
MQLHPDMKEIQAHAGKYQAHGVRHTQTTRQYRDQRGNEEEHAELRKTRCHGNTYQFQRFSDTALRSAKTMLFASGRPGLCDSENIYLSKSAFIARIASISCPRRN